MKLVKTATLCLGLLAATLSVSAFAEIVVIIKADNPATTLERKEVSRIFLGRSKSFPGGGAAVPVNQGADSSVKATFEQELLGKSQSQMKAYWAKLSFSGRGSAPDPVGGDSAVVAKVGSDAEAIGYVDASAINSTVKVIYRL